MKSYGISGELLNWLKNYLCNRQQKVFVNNSTSQFGLIKAGVPQGSILGPLMFLIYINDIANIFDSASRLFADDTSLQTSSASCHQIQTTLNKDLESLNIWAKSWLVTLNPNKTHVLFITNANAVDEVIELTFDDNFLDFTDKHRHLGITLNSDAKWGDHIEEMFKSVLKKVNVLRKLKFTLKRDSLLKIYKTFILPVLEYGCELWDGCSSFDSGRLEKIQLEAARIITGLPLYVKVDALYMETGLEKLSVRRKRRKLQLLYKMHNHLTPDYLTSLLPPTVGENNRYVFRNNQNYRIPYYRLSLTNSSFLPSTLHDWNNLDLSIRSSASLDIFKKAITPEQFSVPSYFNTGDRYLNILHTKLRYECSPLQYDLFRAKLVENPKCSCGYPCENAYHLFFDCNLFLNQRHVLFQFLNQLNVEINLKLILFGNDTLSVDSNSELFRQVQNFLRSSSRFITDLPC